MRVLHLDTGRGMRGGQLQAMRLVEGLRTAGVEGTLLARSIPGSQPFGIASLLRLAPRHDIVHAHDARSHTLAMLLCRKPVVAARRVAFRPRHPGKYARSARVIAVSEHVRSVLIGAGVPAGLIEVVPDGVPALEQAEAAEYVLAPANAADPRKGAALALEAARIAGVELRFSCDLESDLRRAAAFLYLTYSEGLGSAVLLAQSACVPVIASGIGGLPEIVRDGETGLLVRNDPSDVAAALQRVLGDAALARRLGEAGRRAVIEGYTVDLMVRRTMEVYRKVLS